MVKIKTTFFPLNLFKNHGGVFKGPLFGPLKLITGKLSMWGPINFWGIVKRGNKTSKILEKKQFFLKSKTPKMGLY